MPHSEASGRARRNLEGELREREAYARYLRRVPDVQPSDGNGIDCIAFTKGLKMAGGYDVQALYPDLFAGVDPDTTMRTASNFASDAQEGYEATRRDVELMVLLSTDKISSEQFKMIVRAEIGLPPTDVEG